MKLHILTLFLLLCGLIVVTMAYGRDGSGLRVASAQDMTDTVIATEVSTVTLLPTVITNGQWIPQSQTFYGVEMVLVPPGCFMMGSNEGNHYENPVSQQCFEEPFWIDKYDVTNAQFKRLNGKAQGVGSWTGDNRPRDSISWFEARDFCALRKARLPTEAEWEYAARGPDDLMYPWGNGWNANNAVYSGTSGGQTADVGSKPDGISWVGALDMSGNVWQWVSSSFRMYPYDAEDGREDSNFQDGDLFRVLRGGSWLNPLPYNFLAVTRKSALPSARANNYGFRCARNLTPDN